ncbi:TolC family protein [Marivirga sp.]|uniref:TolC family protein n=1 Tax=Marivirga sp. TaxID=2018662 RepID=UPI002D80BD5D|nr:TolC family protein [Marivirga sp.]HET8860646.1 TolC family protein [Marivirga sp.]
MRIDIIKIRYMKRLGIFILLAIFSIIKNDEIKAQSIEVYLQMAAENNPQLQSAYAEFEAALQQSPQVASLPDPTLTISAFGRMIETRVGRQEARFSFMQMFPWFGTLNAKKNAADLMAESEFYKYLDQRNELFYQIKSAYAEIYALDKTIDLQNEQLKILDSYKELTLSQYKSANAPMVNVVKIDIKQDELQTEIELLNEMKHTIQSQFNLLLNRDVLEEIQIQDTIIFETTAILNSGNFMDHPAVEAFSMRQASYESQQTIAKKEGLPMIGLGLDYSIISRRDVANLEGNGRDAIMPMLTLTLPIYRKKYKASIKQAELMGESVEKAQAGLLNELKSDYEAAKYDLLKAEKRLNLYDRQTQSAERALNLLLSGFSNSINTFDEVLQMNQDLLDYQIQKIEAIKAGLTAEARIDYLFSKKEDYAN